MSEWAGSRGPVCLDPPPLEALLRLPTLLRLLLLKLVHFIHIQQIQAVQGPICYVITAMDEQSIYEYEGNIYVLPIVMRERGVVGSPLGALAGHSKLEPEGVVRDNRRGLVAQSIILEGAALLLSFNKVVIVMLV
jgi:hypothetical protein